MPPATLQREISPPASKRRFKQIERTKADQDVPLNALNELTKDGATPAAIEAGQEIVDDHLAYFSKHFAAISRPVQTNEPRLSIMDFQKLYRQNLHDHGRHFVIHQHDHPRAGLHYDLRLQFSKTSTISFAIPYGLPGNPKSTRQSRMAIETRVHNLWNNLIESASHATGSMLIWDTGEYDVLPYREVLNQPMTDDESSEVDEPAPVQSTSPSERLFASFQNAHVRLRLHGQRLPTNYTISLRLTRHNRHSSSTITSNITDRPRKRRRAAASGNGIASEDLKTDSDSDASRDGSPSIALEAEGGGVDMASDGDEDEKIAANNAYTGATNSIGSIHGRHWYLSLDKKNSGFDKRTNADTKSFVVLGRDHERSIVTGRTAHDVTVDEGVTDFKARRRWRPVVE